MDGTQQQCARVTTPDAEVAVSHMSPRTSAPPSARRPTIPVPAQRAAEAVRVPRQATRDRRRPLPQVHSGRAPIPWPPDPGSGRRWHLHTTADGIAVVGGGKTMAEARIAVQREVTVIELWSDTSSTPNALRARLVEKVFAHPAVRAHRPVLVSAARGDSTVITEVLRRLGNPRTRAAGATCLIEGRS
jgi:hypothetical protein